MGVFARVNAGRALKMVGSTLAKAGDLTPVLADFGEHMKGSIGRNFDEEGRPAKWAPLKASTLRSWMGGYKKGGAYRTKAGGLTKAGGAAMAGRKILTATGRLRRSISYKASPKKLEVFTNVKYAAFHQFGTKKMVARAFMLFQDEDKTYLKKILAAWLMGK